MTKKGQKHQKKVEKKELVEKDTNEIAEAVDAYDEEVNSGFGSYLSSATGS